MKIPALILILLQPVLLLAQTSLSGDISIVVSTPYNVVNAPSKEYFSVDGTISIAIKSEGSKVTIQRFDAASMREMSRNEYIDLPKNATAEKTLKIGDHLFYFYSNPTSNQTVAVSAREINMKDGTLMSPRLLFETQGDVAPVLSSTEPFAHIIPYSKHVEILESSNHSKILFRYKRKALNKSNALNYELIGLHVFNTSLEKLWGTEIKMPYTELVTNYVSYAVGKDGTAYMLILATDTYKYEWLAIQSDGVLKSYPVNVPQGYFHELSMLENTEGKFQCLTYYVDPKSYKTSQEFMKNSVLMQMHFMGIIRFTMTKTGVVSDQQLYDFPDEMLSQYEFVSKKYRPGSQPDLKVIQRTEQADGSTVLVGEQVRYVSSSDALYSHFDNIVVTKIDKTGKLVWMVKLPKSQLGRAGVGAMGTKYVQSEGFHYLLFMDSKKNAGPVKDGQPVAYGDGYEGDLTAFRITDATGAYTKHNIFDIENINGLKGSQFTTSRIVKLSEDTLLLELYAKSKQDIMIRMMLK